jgi:ribonuclease HI
MKWLNVQEPKQGKQPVPMVRWSRPPEGWLKVNSDGAMVKSADKGGGGVVICNHDGRFLAGASHFFPSTSDPEEAKLLACWSGLKLAHELKLSKVIFELDSASAVSKLNNPELERSFHGAVIEGIKGSLRDLDEVVVKWVRRSANSVAHILAREGCGLGVNKTWFISVPACIMIAMDLDLSGSS